MVTVAFDPTLIAKPESMEPKPVDEAVGPPHEVPENVFAPDPKDPKVIAEQKEAEEKKTRREGGL